MRMMLMGLAIIMLLIGLVSMVTPLPGGTLLIAGGCALLICTSQRAANWIARQRSLRGWVNRPMIWVEDKLGERLSGPMRRTRLAREGSASSDERSAAPRT